MFKYDSMIKKEANSEVIKVNAEIKVPKNVSANDVATKMIDFCVKNGWLMEGNFKGSDI